MILLFVAACGGVDVSQEALRTSPPSRRLHRFQPLVLAETSGTDAPLLRVGGAPGELFALGAGVILRSRGDGGWTRLSDTTGIYRAVDVAPDQVTIGAAAPGFDAPGRDRDLTGRLRASLDAGATWNEEPFPGAIADLARAGARRFAAAYDGLYRSDDGAAFQKLSGGCPRALAAIGDELWVTWFLDGAPRLGRSRDGGATLDTTPFDGQILFQVSGEPGRVYLFAHSGDDTTWGNVLYRLVGDSWQPRSLPLDGRRVFAFQVVGDQLWIAGERGKLAVSDDDARSWRDLPVPTDRDLRSLFAAAAGDLYAVGDGGTILHAVTP